MPKGVERRGADGSPRQGGTPFAIPPWVPLAATAVIEFHSALPRLPARDIALLERLATAPAMRDVWRKLTAVDAGEIVNMILTAEAAASGVQPPWPKRKQDLAAYVQKTPLVTLGPRAVALFIEQAAQVMRDYETAACALWRDQWPGQPDITFDKLMSILGDMATFYRKLDAFAQQAAAAAPPLPPLPRKGGAKKAKQTYFGLILSEYFKRVGGSPLDDVVGAITGVVFNDASGGPGKDIVRGRRRSARGSKADQT